MKYFLLITLLFIFFSVPAFGIIPNADIVSDKIVNIDLNSLIFENSYDINIKLFNKLESGIRSTSSSSSLANLDKGNCIYIKYQIYNGNSNRSPISIYASYFNIEGSMSSAWGIGSSGISNYKFTGYSFGPSIAFYLTNNFVFRAICVMHSIVSESVISLSPFPPAIPYYVADPNGIELAWIVHPNLEINFGLGQFGIIGAKVKI